MTITESADNLFWAVARMQPGLRVPEIGRALGVSDGTVRNDLNALEKEATQLAFTVGQCSLLPNNCFTQHLVSDIKRTQTKNLVLESMLQGW